VTPPPQPVLPVDPPADMKFDAPFDGTPVAKSTTANGIAIEDFVVGEGPEAVKGGEVEVHYTGYLTDNSVFDTSLKRARPFTFELGAGRVIKGWDEGVAGMKVGGKRKLVIPAKMGYGERRAGKIPPNSTLVFAIELLSFTPPPPPPQPLTAFEGKPVATKKLDKGLVAIDYKLGDGAEAHTGDTVSVHYRGTLKDGTEFDSSLTRPRPLVFPLGQGRVIKGWDAGIAGMKVGGLRKLIIPAELAYGERARGKIPANADLTFTVELMAVKPAAAPADGKTVIGPDGKPAIGSEGKPGGAEPKTETKTGGAPPAGTKPPTDTKTETKTVGAPAGAKPDTKTAAPAGTKPPAEAKTETKVEGAPPAKAPGAAK
jgi:FKBP-type peptidyl-prolyl cis-trans isomerase